MKSVQSRACNWHVDTIRLPHVTRAIMNAVDRLMKGDVERLSGSRDDLALAAKQLHDSAPPRVWKRSSSVART